MKKKFLNKDANKDFMFSWSPCTFKFVFRSGKQRLSVGDEGLGWTCERKSLLNILEKEQFYKDVQQNPWFVFLVQNFSRLMHTSRLETCESWNIFTFIVSYIIETNYGNLTGYKELFNFNTCQIARNHWPIYRIRDGVDLIHLYVLNMHKKLK